MDRGGAGDAVEQRMIAGAVIVVVAVAVLLHAEKRQLPRLRRAAKPIASAGFLLAALHAPALRPPVGAGWLLFAALAAAAVGDVLLIAEGRAWFVAGMAAFSLAHLGYLAWFILHGIRLVALGIGIAVMAAAGHLAWRWLEPHLAPPLRVPVRAYTALVSLMTAFAIAHGMGILCGTMTVAGLLPAAGGILFCASDVAVARHRFVASSFANKVWGLPAYYLAQLLFAAAVR